MKKNVPDERKTKTILELICALDGRIVKVEDAGDGLLVIYANIAHYPQGEEETDLEDAELFGEEYDGEGAEYGDFADCYQTCEDYQPVSEEDWRCINYCPHCGSCMDDAVA